MGDCQAPAGDSQMGLWQGCGAAERHSAADRTLYSLPHSQLQDPEWEFCHPQLEEGAAEPMSSKQERGSTLLPGKKVGMAET